MGVEPRREATRQDVGELVSQMEKATEEAQSALARAASDMARFYDAHRDTKVEFNVGDEDWLDSLNIQTTRPMKKLDDKWFGPFKITAKISRNAYRLALPASMRVHPVFSIVKLRRFTEDRIEGRQQREVPAPEISSDGQERWEVEKIIDSRIRSRTTGRGRRRKKTQFLEYKIRWRGFGKSEDTWEPARNVDGADEAIEEFYTLNPSAPRLPT